MSRTITSRRSTSVQAKRQSVETSNGDSDSKLSAVSHEQIVARANLRIQREMVARFREIRESSGLSTSELADQLGATSEMVEAIESFEYDLSLTEIRHIAIALKAIVEVRVHIATAEHYAKTARRTLEELIETRRIWPSTKRVTSTPSDIDSQVSDLVWARIARTKGL